MPRKKPAPKPKGRPPKIVADDKTIATIAGLAQIQCTQEEAAAVLGVHRNTLVDFLGKDKKGRDAWENGALKGRASLRRQQFKAAESGNTTMLIWLGKQLLGQRDQVVQEHTGAVDVNLVEVRNGIESKLGRIATANAARGVARVTH